MLLVYSMSISDRTETNILTLIWKPLTHGAFRITLKRLVFSNLINTISCKEIVASNCLRNFQKFNYSPGDAPYDVTSIMHYDGKLRGISQTPIMTDKRTRKSIGVNREMSPMDIKKLNKMYPCKPAQPSCGRFLQFHFLNFRNVIGYIWA